MASKAQSTAGFEKGSLALQGLLAVLFGIAAVFWPGLTTATLIYLFSTFLLIDGVIVLVMGLMNLNQMSKALLLLLLGFLELGVGLYLLRHPEVAFATLIVILGFTFVIRGLFSFVHAFTRAQDSSTVRAMHGILGALGVIVGIVVLRQPVASGLAFVWLVGLYALITGPVLIAMSSDLSRSNR